MNDPDRSADTDFIDGLLREDARSHADEYIPDEGFTARVMETLPPPATLPAWRKPALAALWASAGLGFAVALPGALADVSFEFLRVLAAHRLSLTDVGVVMAALAAASWAGTVYTLRRDR